MHLPEVHGGEVDLERALITEGLEADVALHALLARRRAHVGDADVVAQLLLDLLHRPTRLGPAAAHRVLPVAALLAVRARDRRLDPVGGEHGALVSKYE